MLGGQAYQEGLSQYTKLGIDLLSYIELVYTLSKTIVVFHRQLQ